MMVSVVGEEPTPLVWARTRPDVQGKTPRQCRLNVRRWDRERTGCKTLPSKAVTSEKVLDQGCLRCDLHCAMCPRRCLCCCAEVLVASPRLYPS